MALAVLDGNQSATTLSSVVTGGEHIVAHSVVSLGSNAISNIATAVSGTTVCVGSISISGTPSVTGSVSVLNFPASQSTTFGAVTGSVSVINFPASQSVTFGATTGSISVLNFPASQAVTFGQAIVSASNITGLNNSVGTDGNTPTSTNFIKIGGHQDGSNQVEHIVHVSAGGSMKVDASDSTVTFGAVQLRAGTTQIGSVTISNLPSTQTIAGTVTANLGFYPTHDNGGEGLRIDLTAVRGQDSALWLRDGGGNVPISGTVTANLGQGLIDETGDVGSQAPRLVVGVYDVDGIQLGANRPFPISGTVTVGAVSTTVTIAHHQGTSVTTSTFTSTTASTTLASANASREVLTIFNEGAGNLHICAGATCTTIAYQVRLSAGDYYEVPLNQTSLTHSAVFATAGTASVTQIS